MSSNGGSRALYIAMSALSASNMASADSVSGTSKPGLPPIIVNGTVADPDYGTVSPSLQKLTGPVLDTPQSMSTVSGQELDDRGVTILNDALRTVPGISLGAGETSWQGNNVILRGFTTREDIFVDGQRDYGYYYRDPFDTKAVEVLKGPSSVLFGRGSTGGAINQVTKTPTLDPFLTVTGTLSTAEVRRATADLDTPVSTLGPGAALRLNLLADHSEQAGRDEAQSNRWSVAPSLALGLGTPTRLVVSYLHQTDRDIPDYGIPWFDGRPAPVPRNNYYGFGSDYLNTDVNVVTARLEHDINSALQISTQARYSRDTREFRTTEAVVPAGTAATTPVADITVNRNELQGFSTDTFLQDQTDPTLRHCQAATLG